MAKKRSLEIFRDENRNFSSGKGQIGQIFTPLTLTYPHAAQFDLNTKDLACALGY